MLIDKILSKVIESDSLQKEALNEFEKLGFPTVKNEEWKYTNLLKWTKEDYTLKANEVALTDHSQFIIHDSYNLIVLVNGIYQEDLSNIKEDINVISLSKALKTNEIAKANFSKAASFKNDAMAAVNTAMVEDGLFIHVKKSQIIEHTTHIMNLSTSGNALFSNPRTLVVLEENAEARFVETHHNVSEAKVWNNCITEIIQEKSSQITWTKIQNDKIEDTAIVDSTFVQQQKHSVSNFYTFSIGNQLTRNNLNFRLNDEHVESNLSGVTLIGDNQHVDHHTFVDHAFANCVSNEDYKGIFTGKSKGVFNGKVLVRIDAQKTNAYQNNANILLSETASVDTKPQLEIFADDVKCSHGCTVGHQNEEALFYMKQRGLSANQAQGILNLAFVGQITDSIKTESLKNYILQIIQNKLS